MARGPDDDRGLSPVVGTALLIAIVLLFSVVAGYVFFGLSDTSDPAPQVRLEAESDDDLTDWRLVHGGGDELRGSNLVLRGTATPNAARGQNLSVDDEVAFYPTERKVTVVWDGGDDTTYELATVEVEQPLPEPDEGCEWVLSKSNNGTDEVTVDGTVVDCDVDTSDNVYVENGGTVVGAVVSDTKVLDLDDGEVYGDVDVFKVANLQNGSVTGDVRSRDEEVKLYLTTVGGSVDAADKAEVLDGSRVEGDVESQTGTVQIQDSTVEGSITADDTVDLDDATVEGHVYVDPGDFECTNATVNGEDCGSYSPRDPTDW